MKFDMGPYVRKWLDKQVRRNLWRMPRWVDEDDLRQAGMYYWVMVNDRYDARVTEVKHMMSLFMKAYSRHIIDLANERTDAVDRLSLDEIAANEPRHHYTKDALHLLADAEPDVAMAIAEAPEPVKTILRLLTDPKRGILSARLRTFKDGTRDTTNARLHRAVRRCGITDIDPSTDLLALVHSYLHQQKKQPLDKDIKRVRVVRAYTQFKLPDEAHAKEARRGRVQVTRDYAPPGVRCRAQDTKPRKQVPQHPRAQVRT